MSACASCSDRGWSANEFGDRIYCSCSIGHRLMKDDQAAAAAVPARQPYSGERDVPVRLNISGRTIYACLKNMLLHDFKITREAVLQRLTEVALGQNLIQAWLDSPTMRAHVRSLVNDVMPRVLREEAVKAMQGRVKITIE